MPYVKQSLMIIVTASAISLFPAYALASTNSVAHLPKVSASETPAPSAGSAATAAKRDALLAARTEFRNAMTKAQNGRDLAFADANATMLESLTAAGKDKVALKAAHEVYRASAMQIITAYKQAVASSIKDYRSAIAAAKGK